MFRKREAFVRVYGAIFVGILVVDSMGMHALHLLTLDKER
jgi:hypothetical protein